VDPALPRYRDNKSQLVLAPFSLVRPKSTPLSDFQIFLVGLQFAISIVEITNVVTTCLYCGSGVSFGMRLLHGRYCSAEHQDAYFNDMDRLGLERLTAAKPSIQSYEPCTKSLDLGSQLQQQLVH
jgi:hypothetical protein